MDTRTVEQLLYEPIGNPAYVPRVVGTNTTNTTNASWQTPRHILAWDGFCRKAFTHDYERLLLTEALVQTLHRVLCWNAARMEDVSFQQESWSESHTNALQAVLTWSLYLESD